MIVTALAVVIVLAVWQGWADPLLEAWSAWLDGEPMSDVSLWGRDMRFWERVGKVCIFLAGMSVLLDLADPERLRGHGRAATRMIEEAQARAAAARMEKRQAQTWFTASDDREAEQLLSLGATVKNTIVYSKAIATTPYSASSFLLLRYPSERARKIAGLVSGDKRFDEASLRNLHESLLASSYDGCTRPSQCLSEDEEYGRELCNGCQDHVHHVVERYTEGLLRDSERDLLRRRQEVIDRTQKVFDPLSMLVLGLGAVVLASPVIGIATGNRSLGLALVTVASLLWIALVIFMAGVRPRQHLALLLEARAAATKPVVAFHRAVAMVLDKAKPGHVFRWIAFGLFVVGSHFDLLSS